MSDCCTAAACELEKLRARQARVLEVVLAVNVVMWVVEASAGVIASSTALLGDSLDMLGDALVYGFSLYVVGRDDVWKARAARLKGWIMVVFGLSVLGHTAYKIVNPELPSAPLIGVVGLLALLANVSCLVLLTRHRADDVNMRSVWLCSRNDVIANVSVLGAGAAVWLTQSQTPDVLVGFAIAALFLRSAASVLRDAARTSGAVGAVAVAPLGREAAT
jgi:Co/Zn/Cd efflux system component